MANTFKNASRAIAASPGTVVYTAPAGVTAVIHTLAVSNVSSVPENITIHINDASASTSFRLMKDVPVPVGGTMYFPKPINLEEGDSIRLTSSSTNLLEAFLSILEIT